MSEIVSDSAVAHALVAYYGDGWVHDRQQIELMRAALLASGYPQKVVDQETELARLRLALQGWITAETYISTTNAQLHAELTRLRAENASLAERVEYWRNLAGEGREP